MSEGERGGAVVEGEADTGGTRTSGEGGSVGRGGMDLVVGLCTPSLLQARIWVMG